MNSRSRSSRVSRDLKDGSFEYVLVDGVWPYVVLRSVVINTIKPMPVDLNDQPWYYDQLKGEKDPYDILPSHVEPVYLHELTEDIVKGMALLANRVLPEMLKDHPNAVFQQHLDFWKRNSERYGKEQWEPGIDRRLTNRFPELYEDFHRSRGIRRVMDAFSRHYGPKDKITEIEKELQYLESSRLVFRLPDKAYVATMEGFRSYVFSPFSQALLFSKDPDVGYWHIKPDSI